jgi:transketolase
MINPSAHLSPKIFQDDIDQAPTRKGYGEGLVIAGTEDEKVVVLCADLTVSTMSSMFRDKFPDRFVEVGVAEQGMATIASGMANYGKIPFISSYAAFSPGRNWEQIRTTAALANLPVKIAGAHAGVSVGPDGATHQMLEDIALMRAMPNMIVLYPGDAMEAKKATIAAAKNGKPTYLRFAREKTPVYTTEETPFEIGKALTLWESGGMNQEVGIIATGPLVYEALLAAKELDANGIGSIVLDVHTIKPLDDDAVLNVARKTGAIVTVEEHQITGGLGGAVAELLSKRHPTHQEYIGMPDHFGESGEPDELLEKYHMKAKDIVEAAKKVIGRKNS